MNNNNRGLAVIGLALVCSMLLYQTNGGHGIGWFIAGLVIIFGF